MGRLQELGELGVLRSVGRKSNRYSLPMYAGDVAAGRFKGPRNSAAPAPLEDAPTVQLPPSNSATPDIPTVQPAAPEQSLENHPYQNHPLAPAALETATPFEEKLALRLSTGCGFDIRECRTAVARCRDEGFDLRMIVEGAVGEAIDRKARTPGYLVTISRDRYQQRTGGAA